MDSLRLGRVLGVGARLAGRTLVAAVDAAASPKPGTAGKTESAREAVIPSVKRQAPGPLAPKQRVKVADVRRGGRPFGEAMWGPVARASGVLWLEVMGVFFGLIAMAGVQGMWSYRNVMRMGVAGHGPLMTYRPFLLSAAIALLFSYFCISNFLRAARRGRQTLS